MLSYVGNWISDTFSTACVHSMMWKNVCEWWFGKDTVPAFT